MKEEDNRGDFIQRTSDYSMDSWGTASKEEEFPAAGELLPATEEVVFLEPGDEKAQNIITAMSCQNAGDVVQLLSEEGPLNMSDISDRLAISLNSAKYHIGQLTSAGVLEVSDTRYSVKGKIVKLYRLKNQVFIVAPKKTSAAQVRSALLRYNAAFVIFVSVFCVSLFQGQLSSEIYTFYLNSIGSSQPAIIQTLSGGIVPALVSSTVVTLLLLVIFQVYTTWKEQQEHKRTWCNAG